MSDADPEQPILPPLATWDQVLFNPVVDTRPPLDTPWISFLDKDKMLKFIPLTIPDNTFLDLCTWENEVDDYRFVDYRRYWISVRERLRTEPHGCSKLYNVYIPLPKKEDEE